MKLHLLPLPLLLIAVLSGCHQGMTTNTTSQDETGNGIEMVTGELQIESVTVVAAEDDSGDAAVSAVIVNGSADADRLTSITVEGRQAVLTPSDAEIPAGAAVSVATGGAITAVVTGITAQAGEFVEVTFRFGTNGSASDEVLVVPPVAFYEDYAPQAAPTPQPEPEPTPEPTPTPTPTPAVG